MGFFVVIINSSIPGLALFLIFSHSCKTTTDIRVWVMKWQDKTVKSTLKLLLIPQLGIRPLGFARASPATEQRKHLSMSL